MLLHENALVKIDKSVPLEHAALMGCAVMTGIGAVVHAAKVEAGASMAVVGCGGVGLNILQGGRLVGARCIVAVDTSMEKLQLAKRFGATVVVDASNEDAVAAVRAATGGGVDYAFEAVGKKLTVEQSIAMLRPGGLATIAGVMPAGMTFEVGGEKLLDGEYRIQGTKLGTNRFRTDIPRYLELYQEGRIELEALISERIALDDVNDAYDMLEIGAAARSVIVFK
jgi:S-(hydroxymethyl)glutathione dehydrogenase/alcohol dehydrogenase